MLGSLLLWHLLHALFHDSSLGAEVDHSRYQLFRPPRPRSWVLICANDENDKDNGGVQRIVCQFPLSLLQAQNSRGQGY
jgi:hypothetical protein